MGSIETPSSKMERYTLRQANSKQEMDGIMDVIWAANYTPYEPFAQLFFPVFGCTAAAREASLAESKERFWNNHLADPSSNWFYVVETKTGQTVGCAQWEIFKSNPFPNGVPRLEAPWWPDREHREFCESILNQVYKPRGSWMTRPHLALNWMAVHPSHRRRGIGSLLMHEGISRANELNVECWMEASLMGKPLYEKFGFRSLSKIDFDTNRKDASDVWRKCQHEMTPEPVLAMWRPKQEIWHEIEMSNGKKQIHMPYDSGKQ